MDRRKYPLLLRVLAPLLAGGLLLGACALALHLERLHEYADADWQATARRIAARAAELNEPERSAFLQQSEIVAAATLRWVEDGDGPLQLNKSVISIPAGANAHLQFVPDRTEVEQILAAERYRTGAEILFCLVALIAALLFLLRAHLLRHLNEMAMRLGAIVGEVRLNGLGDVEIAIDDLLKTFKESESQLTSLLEHLPGTAYRVDCRNAPAATIAGSNHPAGTVVYARGRVGGIARLLVEGEPWGLNVPVGYTQVLARRQEAIDQDEAWALEYPVNHLGVRRWLQDQGRAVRDELGKVCFLDGMLLDVTEQRAAQSRNLVLAQALDRSTCEVYLLDPLNLRASYANKGALAAVGHQLLNKPFPALLRDKEKFLDLVDRLRRGELGEAQLQADEVRADGRYSTAQQILSFVGSHDDPKLLVISLDISERENQRREIDAQRERLELVMEATGDGVYDLDLVSGEFYATPRAMDAVGHEHGARPNVHDIINNVHPEDRERFEAALVAHLQSRERFDLEYRFLTKDGVYRWLRSRAQARWDEKGRPVRLTGAVADVTDRKMGEFLLRDSLTRLRAVLDHVSEGILTLDVAGVVVTANPAAQAILRLSEPELIGRKLNYFFPNDEPLAQAYAQDDVVFDRFSVGGVAKESVGRRNDNTEFFAELSVDAMQVANAAMYTVVLRDVSERHASEAALVAARDRAEAATRAKSEFFAMMTHEIRTPLNGVLGMAQVLSDSLKTPEQLELIDFILNSGESLLEIINGILDFSKLEAGRMNLEPTQIDLRELADTVMQLVASGSRQDQVELIVDIPTDVPRRVYGNLIALRQILTNLVGNAVKFTREGRVVLGIRALETEGGRSTFLFTIEDTGIGIAPDAVSRIFDLFTQADSSTAREFGGTGLGLAITKRLVDALGGQLLCESESGQGSCFSVRLTLELSDAPIAVFAQQRCSLGIRLADPQLRAVLVRDLAALGYTVHALDNVHSDLPSHMDLLLHDVVSVDELDAYVPALRGRTLVLLPPHLRAHRRVAAQKGFADALIKPVKLDAIEKALIKPSANREADSPVAITDSASRYDIRVLLVDDNETNQHVARRMLEQFGCQVDVANDGDEALRYFTSTPYDLVFMDLRMPGLDGYETTHLMRAREVELQLRRTPVIAMTANQREEDEARCLAAGMDDFVAKPVKRSLLLEVLARRLGSADAEFTDSSVPPPFGNAVNVMNRPA